MTIKDHSVKRDRRNNHIMIFTVPIRNCVNICNDYNYIARDYFSNCDYYPK